LSVRPTRTKTRLYDAAVWLSQFKS